METYNGHVRTPTDAIILFEACRIGLLPRVQRRLSEKERQSITSGSVFVWDEREAGMRRWTDGKSWSASRVSGSFLTYREMEGKRGGGGMEKSANRDGVHGAEADSDGGPEGYRYKVDGLMKQSFSITTNNGQHLHLISYFHRSAANSQTLMQPSSDPQLRHIRPEKGMYPESTVNEQQNIPAVTRGPMSSPGYTHAPHQAPTYGRAPPYAYGPPAYPPSPMHTPPPHTQYSPYYQNPPHGPYPGQSPLQNMHYPPPPGFSQPQSMTAFDRAPPPLSNNGLPPPPPQYSGQMPPQQGYQNGYGYGNGNGNTYPPYQPPPLQHPSYPPPPQQPTYDARSPVAASTEEQQSTRPEARPEGPQEAKPEEAQLPAEPQAQAQPGAQAPASSGQTIPSISAMLNSGEAGQPPARTSSKSPNSTAQRQLQDIPSHKLGFEGNRDVQALRSLDKSTFKY